MKKSKKLWIILPIAAVLLAGAVYGFLTLRQRNNKIYVQSVAELNNPWVLMNESSYGTITDSAEQAVYVEAATPVAEVHVAVGQHVSAGDALFRYDTQTLQLELQERQISVDAYAASLDVARKQLAAYQKIVPVAAKDPEPEEIAPYELTASQRLPAEPQQGSGTEADPFRYNCTEEMLVTGEQINGWLEEGVVVSLEIWEGGVMPEPADPIDPADPTDPTDPVEPAEEPVPLAQWIIGEKYTAYVDPESYWSVATRELWFPPEPEEPDTPAPITYTEAEKAKLISDQQLTIRRLENSLALAQNAMTRTQRNLDSSTVRATMTGTVRTICDPASPPQDGSPFCVVAGDGGVTLTGYISELDLGTAKVGDKLSVSSWMTGAVTDAEITAISDFPADQGGYFYSGSGNPNVSYYQFTAYMESSEGFSEGESASIQPYVEELEQVIVIQKMYVRTDTDGAYVLADDGAGRLERRDVTMESTSEQEFVKILTGLTEEDMVAFPYGKSAYVGALTTTEMRFSLF